VPIFVERFGRLETTQSEIGSCLDACRRFSDVQHFEVETYAWSVLPESYRPAKLADGIAAEMRWFWERPACV
jgi:hypothetical protein